MFKAGSSPTKKPTPKMEGAFCKVYLRLIVRWGYIVNLQSVLVVGQFRLLISES